MALVSKELKGFLALLIGRPGSGKTAFAKLLIRNLIQKGNKKVDGDEPLEGFVVFAADRSQWQGIVPQKCLIDPTGYDEQWKSQGIDWWEKFYNLQQENLTKNGKYSPWLIVVDDIFLFSDFMHAGGNRTTSFEKVLSMYRVWDTKIIVTSQRTVGFTKFMREFGFIFGFWSQTGKDAADKIYEQFGEGAWDNKDDCRDDFMKLSDEISVRPHQFIYINTRKGEKRFENLGPEVVEMNAKFEVQFDNDAEIIPTFAPPPPEKKSGGKQPSKQANISKNRILKRNRSKALMSTLKKPKFDIPQESEEESSSSSSESSDSESEDDK